MVQWFQPGWSRRMEGNVLFNDALNTFYLRLNGRKEGNVLFNDELNTFYLRLYGVARMVRFKDAPHTRSGRYTTGLHGVDPLNYFSFQPVLHDWCNKGRGM